MLCITSKIILSQMYLVAFLLFLMSLLRILLWIWARFVQFLITWILLLCSLWDFLFISLIVFYSVARHCLSWHLHYCSALLIIHHCPCVSSCLASIHCHPVSHHCPYVLSSLFGQCLWSSCNSPLSVGFISFLGSIHNHLVTSYCLPVPLSLIFGQVSPLLF